jgi:hypothetical protein
MREEKKARRSSRGLPLRLQRRGLPHGLRAELEQLRARDRRVHARRSRRRRVADQGPHQRQGGRHLPRQGPLEEGRPSAWSLRRPRGAVRQHHQRLAHLPEQRAHQREQPLLGVHVPRRHGLQPVVAQPHEVPERGRRRTLTSTSRATATRRGCSSSRRRSSSITRPTRRSRSRRTRTTTARSAWATPTSAPCSCSRASRTTRTRAAPSRRAHRDPLRPRLQGLGRDVGLEGPFNGLRQEPRAHAARDGHAPRRGLRHRPRRLCPEDLWRAACEDWDEAVRLGHEHGYRNAQATVLAPTGTIGLLMDCDTTGIEPDFSLVKFKKLAGGGYFKIVNQSVPEALRRLGYAEAEVREIVAYVSGTNTLLAAPNVNRATLKQRASAAKTSPRSRRPSRASSISSSPSGRGSWATTPTIASACRWKRARGLAFRSSATSASSRARSRRPTRPSSVA